MKYLKSTTQKSYLFSGRYIPSCVTKDNDVLSVSDDDFRKMQKNPVIASLINAGAIIAMDKAPTTPTQQAKQLTNKVAAMTLENTTLREENASLKAQLAGVGAGTDSEIAALKQQLTDQKQADLEEITALKNSTDAEIASLKAQLEAATSASKTAAAAAAKVAEGE